MEQNVEFQQSFSPLLMQANHILSLSQTELDEPVPVAAPRTVSPYNAANVLTVVRIVLVPGRHPAKSHAADDVGHVSILAVGGGVHPPGRRSLASGSA